MSSILARMAVQISANTAEFNKALSKTNKDLNSFTNGIKNIAGTLGVAFGAQQIANFAFEVSKLAGEAEGVGKAFDKLNNSKQLLIDLKEATRGTVSELNLMKRSVQFSNFGLELSKLPTLLEFATKRAQSTGQSVDYLVDSIVTGLGRKSVLILDNLGISAIQLREEMAKVGDITVAVSNIIEKDMAAGGKIVETVALRTERLAASWDNFKVSIGRAANDTGLLGNALESLNQVLIVLGSETLSAGEKIVFMTGNPFQKAAILTTHYAKQIAEANQQTQRMAVVNKNAADAFKKYNGNLEEFKKHIAPGHANTELLIEAFKKLQQQQTQQIKLEGTLQGAMEEQAVLQKQKLTLRGEELIQTNIRLKQLSEEIKMLNELGVETNKVSKARSEFLSMMGFTTAAEKIRNKGTGSTKREDVELPQFNFEVEFTGAMARQDILLATFINKKKEQLQALSDEFERLGNLAINTGDIIANALEGAFSGAFSGVQILARATQQIVDLFARQAIAAAIANAAKSGGPFPFASVALAAAAAGAMKSLLSRVGIGSRFGGGGSGSGGGFSNVTNPNSLFFNNASRQQTIVLEARGTSLVAVSNEQSRRDNRTRANTRRLS